MNGNQEQVFSDADVQEIVKKIRALQQLTATTGTITTRTQSHLLRPLPEDVLTRVSLVLAGGQ